jgi:hypothetical protein
MEFTEDTLKKITNNEFITWIMNYSNSGALSQAVVIEALRYYTDYVLKKGEPVETGNEIIRPIAWYKAAEEINQKVKLKYGN